MLHMISKDKRDGKKFLTELSSTKYFELVLKGGSQQGLCDIEDLKRLEKLQIKDLTSIGQGSEKNPFLRKLYHYYAKAHNDIEQQKLQKSNNLRFQGQQKEHNKLISSAEYIKRQCPTLFSKDQINNYIGECLLKNAIEEKNSNKKMELINHGIEQFSKNPKDMDLPNVVGLLSASDSVF